MWLFWLFEALGFIAVLVMIFIYCRFRKQGFWSFIWRNLKWVSLSILVVWLLIAILNWRHLYNATQCHFRGVSMHANTKYSIYLGECQIETPSGAFVPIDRTRALPGGNQNGAEDDMTTEYYNY